MRFAPVIVVCSALLIAACDQAIDPTIASIGGQTTSTDTSTVAITITPASPQLAIAGSVQLSTNAASTLLPLVWSSSNATIASVSSTGLVTAVGAGTATITVSSAANSGSNGTTLVTVSQ